MKMLYLIFLGLSITFYCYLIIYVDIFTIMLYLFIFIKKNVITKTCMIYKLLVTLQQGSISSHQLTMSSTIYSIY